MGTERVPGTYRQQKGVREHMATGKVPGYIQKTKGFLDTYRHQQGAQAHIGVP